MTLSNEALHQEQDESRIVVQNAATKLRRLSRYEEMMQDEDDTDTPTYINIKLNDLRETSRHSFYTQLCNSKYKLILNVLAILIFSFEIFRKVISENFMKKMVERWKNNTILNNSILRNISET